MRVLVVNAGSSSLKLRVLDADDRAVAAVDLEEWAGGDAAPRIAGFVAGHGPVDAVGHRVVHGGAVFQRPAVLDAETRKAIEALCDLAPLHQPRALAGIDAAADALPGTPAVACFDTAFHAGLPLPAATYALPHEWTRRWSLRRYGFHGLSHAYAARRAAAMLGRSGLRLVTCHLGAGASLTAVAGGRPVDTTMGFTPLEGLVMATRGGTVDPGLLLWLLQHTDLSAGELADAMEHRSGLAGLSGVAGGDLRAVRQAAHDGDPRAVLAVEVYVHQVRRHVGAMVASLGGLDALVFTGGVGEHQPFVRAAVAAGLGFLGVGVDVQANETAAGDADVSAAGAAARTLVVSAREDIEIARGTRSAIGA